MILLKKIHLINFLSHENTVIEMSDNDQLLIDGKSGSGKSSIVEAIIWNIYGEARVDNRNLVRNGVDKATVSIMYHDTKSDTYYSIERSTTVKAKNSLLVEYSDDGSEFRPIERTGLKDTQDWITNEFIKASYTLFINSIAYPQDNAENFVKQTATKRKDLLLEIANVSNFDTYYNRAKEELSLKKEGVARIESSIETNRKMIESQSEKLVDEEKILQELSLVEKSIELAQKELDSYKKEKDLALDSLNQLSIAESKELEVKGKLSRVTGYLSSSQLKLNTVKSIKLEELKEKSEKLKELKEQLEVFEIKKRSDYERMSKLNAIMADKPSGHNYDLEIERLQQMLLPLIQDTGKCSAGDACPFVKPIKDQIGYLSAQIADKEKERELYLVQIDIHNQKISALPPVLLTDDDHKNISELQDKLKLYAGAEEAYIRALDEVNSLQEIEQEVESWKKELESIEIEQNTIKKDKELILSLINKDALDSLDKKIEEVTSHITSFGYQKRSLDAKIALSQSAREMIKKLENEISELSNSISGKRKEIESLELIKEAFGSKGLKTVVIDYLTPRLEEKINEILSKLSDFRVQLDTQRDNSDGSSTIEGLFINIFNEQGEQFDFNNYSGGEKLKITVAISEALASLQRCGFRIFDELFIGLDEDSTDHFAEVVNQLQNEFGQVLCISHLRSIKDLFDRRVEIIKTNGVSQIM